MAKKQAPYAVGDKLVDFGKVYTITQVKTQESNGEREDILCFEPMYPTKKNETVVHSIPRKNLNETRKRRVLTKDQLNDLFDILKKKPKNIRRVNLRSAKTVIKKNDAEELTKLLKKLSVEKFDDSRDFTYTRRRLYRQSMRCLAEETAAVRDVSVNEAQKMIEQALKSSQPAEDE